MLLTACDNAAFNSDGVSLVLSRSYNDGALEESYLRLSSALDKEDDYSLILRSPDSSLEWNSPLKAENGMYVSEELAITRGAAFPEGDYTWFIMSSSGKELTGNTSLSYDSSPILPSAAAVGEGDTLEWLDGDGRSTDDSGSASYALISTHDSYGNPISVKETI